MENRQSVRPSLSFLHEMLNLPIDPYPFAVDEAFDAYRLIVESCEFHDLLIIIYFSFCRWRTHRHVGEEIERHYVRRFRVSLETKKLWRCD